MSEFSSSLRLNNALLCVYHILLIHSSADGHLGCLHVLATVNDATLVMDIKISLQNSTFNSLGYIPRSGIAGSPGNSIFTFLSKHHAISIMETAFYISANSAERFQYLHILIAIIM